MFIRSMCNAYMCLCVCVSMYDFCPRRCSRASQKYSRQMFAFWRGVAFGFIPSILKAPITRSSSHVYLSHNKRAANWNPLVQLPISHMRRIRNQLDLIAVCGGCCSMCDRALHWWWWCRLWKGAKRGISQHKFSSVTFTNMRKKLTTN